MKLARRSIDSLKLPKILALTEAEVKHAAGIRTKLLGAVLIREATFQALEENQRKIGQVEKADRYRAQTDEIALALRTLGEIREAKWWVAQEKTRPERLVECVLQMDAATLHGLAEPAKKAA